MGGAEGLCQLLQRQVCDHGAVGQVKVFQQPAIVVLAKQSVQTTK